MKILWFINNLPPKIAQEVGLRHGHALSWVEAMAEKIKTNVNLSIASPGKVKKLKVVVVDNVTYYIFPGKKAYKRNFKLILDDVCPDIVHVYGTEYAPNHFLIKHFNKYYPMLISIQGVLNEYYHHYYAGLTISEILKTTTFGDIVFRRGIISGRKSFKKRSKPEQEAFQNVKYVEGRSTWDKCAVLKINNSLQYYYCPRMIREPFYTAEWNIDKMEPHSVFVHQGFYPVKGLHFLLDAVYLLKKQYSDIKLYISGDDFMHPKTLKRKLAFNGYYNLIKRRVKKLDLEANIIFTGFLSAAELADKLSTVNVCVSPSSIENVPNSVAETMLVGTPCVASYVGGNPEMLNEGMCGYLYAHDEPIMLAQKIAYIFENKHEQEVLEMTERAKKVAKTRHDRQILVDTLINIYQDIMQKEKNDMTQEAR